MATRGRLNLTDLKPDESAPALAVLAVDAEGKVLHKAVVDAKGGFELPDAAMKGAHRVLIGPAEGEPGPDAGKSFARYRTSQFASLVEAGVISIARPQWEIWRFFFTCVTGSVRLCRRAPWWYADLDVLARRPATATSRVLRASTPSAVSEAPALRATAARSLADLIAWPIRCRTICNGKVEVYRRHCCCRPWILDDPRFDDLIAELEDLQWPPLPDPPIPDPPFPGPDPLPFGPGAPSRFFKDGTLDERAVYAARDLQAIRTLPRTELPAYINARPYLLCVRSCSAPVKVAEGDINPDGRFNLCFRDWPRPAAPFCHDEFAYVVKQRFGFFWITVYNGVAANVWFHRGDDARLTTSHPLAFSCRENGEPGTGAFVYLDIIGDTSSHELETPPSTGWDRVAPLNTTSGLVFPNAASPLDRHRNWGGTLKLSYMFSEDLKSIGAKYYRLSITRATAAGAPTGSREYYDQGLSWKKAVSGDIVPVTLGPTTVGGENALYEIPYDADANWEAGQYHAHLDTNDPRWSDPLVRHLVTVEVFDATGRRLRPNGTPATGQTGTEVTAAFTYRRKTTETGPTQEVPFGALTHAFWWDNRKVVAEIVQLVQNGTPSSAECQFLAGDPSSTFGITYRAYHEQGLFQRSHHISWKRGLSGATGDILNPGLGNVGQPPAAPGASPTTSFATMLGTHRRCAFTVFLTTYGKTTDGDDLGYPHAGDSAAFALEVD